MVTMDPDLSEKWIKNSISLKEILLISMIIQTRLKVLSQIQPQTPPIIKKEESSRENYSGLSNFFESKGLKVVDKRLHGGALWVVGQKSEIDTYVREAGKLYGAYGNYVSEGKSKAINLKAGWYTKCQK